MKCFVGIANKENALKMGVFFFIDCVFIQIQVKVVL